jgi:hypothetical protein
MRVAIVNSTLSFVSERAYRIGMINLSIW